MKLGWSILFAGSLSALLFVLVRHRISWGGLTRFGLHIAAAALVLYLLNGSGLIPGFHVPLNPSTMAAVMLLGVPGILLILGLQWSLL